VHLSVELFIPFGVDMPTSNLTTTSEHIVREKATRIAPGLSVPYVPVLHGVGNVGGLDNVLNENSCSQRSIVGFVSATVFRSFGGEGSVPTFFPSLIQLAVENVGGKYNIYDQLTEAHHFLLCTKDVGSEPA
jgi:hypothetical protein